VAGHSSCRHVRFSTDSRRERRYVRAPKAEAVPGEAPRKKLGSAVGQFGGAVAPNSAHFTVGVAAHGGRVPRRRKTPFEKARLTP
jgi:hypothetical protein